MYECVRYTTMAIEWLGSDKFVCIKALLVCALADREFSGLPLAIKKIIVVLLSINFFLLFPQLSLCGWRTILLLIEFYLYVRLR
jgi:hypothetical protein